MYISVSRFLAMYCNDLFRQATITSRRTIRIEVYDVENILGLVQSENIQVWWILVVLFGHNMLWKVCVCMCLCVCVCEREREKEGEKMKEK